MKELLHAALTTALRETNDPSIDRILRESFFRAPRPEPLCARVVSLSERRR